MSAIDRHANRISTEHDQEIVSLKNFARLLLIARQRTHKAWMIGDEMRAIGDSLLISRTAEPRGEKGRFVERVALDDLVADHQDRTSRG
jgi:hypothetical protein